MLFLLDEYICEKFFAPVVRWLEARGTNKFFVAKASAILAMIFLTGTSFFIGLGGAGHGFKMWIIGAFLYGWVVWQEKFPKPPRTIYVNSAMRIAFFMGGCLVALSSVLWMLVAIKYRHSDLAFATIFFFSGWASILMSFYAPCVLPKMSKTAP